MKSYFKDGESTDFLIIFYVHRDFASCIEYIRNYSEVFYILSQSK